MNDILSTLIQFAKADVEPALLTSLNDADLVALGKAVSVMYPAPSASVKKAIGWIGAEAQSRGLVE